MSCRRCDAKRLPPTEFKDCRIVFFGRLRNTGQTGQTYFPVFSNCDGSLRLLRFSDSFSNNLIDDYLTSAKSKALEYTSSETPTVAFHNAGEFKEDLSQAAKGRDYMIENITWKKMDGRLAGLNIDDKNIINKINQIRKERCGTQDGALVWKWDTRTRNWEMKAV